MIALLLALQAATAPLPALGALPPQALPPRGCAAYLWSRADRRFVAVAGADPASLRLALDGRATDLPRESQTGAGAFGLPDRAGYRLGDLTATLEMTVQPRAEISDGAVVSEATLTIARAGGDATVVPVAGLIGCRSTNGTVNGVETRRGSVR